MLDASILQDFDFKTLLSEIEKMAAHEIRLERLFRSVPLEVYGLLQFTPSAVPQLAKLLPRMPSEEDQVKWTGTSGSQLLDITANYVKSLVGHTTLLTGKPVDEVMFLDHGCGWGRIPRFLSRFIPAEQIYGFDPMQSSIDICLRDRVPGTYRLCDAYPETLPVDTSVKFHLINVFSVFTHLNEKYQFKVLKALRKYVSDEGVLAATIRRETFWGSPRFDNTLRQGMIKDHRVKGFAHLTGGNLGREDEESFFGETSTSIEYVKTHWKGWELVATDISTFQPDQIVLFIKPA